MALLFLFASGAVRPARAEEKELTILVYICGSDLESEEGEATGDIREMLSSGVGKSDAATVLVATGGSSRWQRYGISSRNVQYYRLAASEPVLLKDAGQMNMGDADTLSRFLSFGMSQAPARRYILVLWDHGGGPIYGLCNDENYRDDSLTLSELRQGLTRGLNGARLEIIGFDCCLMNCLDLCADLEGIADYAVVSQELVSGTGFNYDEWMKPILANPAISSQQIAMSMAETYVQENSRGRSAGAATMSVVDTSRMPAVMEAANAFCAAMSEQMKSNLSGVIRLRTKLTSFGEFADYDASDLVDVADLCDAASALLPAESAALKQQAEQAVCYNCATKDIAAYAHGLSLFMPYSTVNADRQKILSHYSGRNDSYALFVTELAKQASSAGYSMGASSYTPDNFYSWDDYYGDDSCSGSFCDIWDGYYGDACSFDDVCGLWGADIWTGLSPSSGSIWDGYSSSSGIWSGWNPGAGYGPQGGYGWDGYYGSDDYYGAGSDAGYGTEVGGIWAGLQGPQGSTDTSSGSDTTVTGGIWAGAPDTTTTEPPSTEPPYSTDPSAYAALNSIWAGLLNSNSDYYQPQEPNQNVQPGISDAASSETVLQAAETYFSSATLNAQMVYSIQLTKQDLDHLASASGVLSRQEGEDIICLGNLGQTTIDWSTGLVFSMFDGSWPMLDGYMVRAELFYSDEEGNTRFVIPARVNGVRMYLLGNRAPDGSAELLGATQGYDENGFAIRGSIPLEAGMELRPLFTAVSPDGTERQVEGDPILYPEGGLQMAWDRIPAGDYLYSFALKDLSGTIHNTDAVPITF